MMAIGMMAAKTAAMTGATIATSVFECGALEPGFPPVAESEGRIHNSSMQHIRTHMHTHTHTHTQTQTQTRPQWSD